MFHYHFLVLHPCLKIGRPREKRRPVVTDVHMSRRARRRLGGTGAVSKQVENVRADACHAASQLWDVCCDRQSVVWLDNWYRRRFGTNPDGDDQSLNVSALAILHVPELDPFPGHPSLN